MEIDPKIYLTLLCQASVGQASSDFPLLSPGPHHACFGHREQHHPWLMWLRGERQRLNLVLGYVLSVSCGLWLEMDSIPTLVLLFQVSEEVDSHRAQPGEADD